METPLPEVPQINSPSLMEVAKQVAHDQSARHAVMRSFNGTGYAVAGTLAAVETPGVLPKVVGGALFAKGMYEEYAAVKQTTPETARHRLQERIFTFADSLVDNNSGKMNLVARLKRRSGEEILNFRDQEFSTRFNRMVGGMAVLMAGAEFATQPGVVNKVIGITLGNVGLAEQVFNTQKLNKRLPEIAK